MQEFAVFAGGHEQPTPISLQRYLRAGR